jgi:2-polyprenyl-6-methoxyphenol hydroxylase-like FAD-dependent oxidoreductase
VTSAIVVGGAVAGLAAARALAAGAEVTVLERRPDGVAEGAGLVIYPAGTHALDRLGALAAFRQVSVPLEGIATYDRKGRRLHLLDTRSFAERYGHPLAGVHRADLMQALAENLKADVRRGVEVTDVKVGEVVQVRTRGGALEADALVGADGIRSSVRECLGLGADPRRTGWVAWRGVAPAPAGFETATAGLVLGAGRHGGWVAVAGDRVYWFLTGDEGEPGDLAGALRATRGWRTPLPQLIEATPPGTVLFNELIDRDPDARWGRGPVTLAGDAAHAMLPSLAQGANQALEDAATLLAMTGEHGVGEKAFRAYEKRRAARTTRVVKLSRQVFPILEWRSLPARWLRARLLALPPSMTEKQVEWLYRAEV